MAKKITFYMYLCNKSGKICGKAEPMKTSRFRKKMFT